MHNRLIQILLLWILVFLNLVIGQINPARSHLAGAGSNGVIAFEGGFGLGASSIISEKSVDIFNVTDGSTQPYKTSELTETRGQLSGAGTGGFLYFGGGSSTPPAFGTQSTSVVTGTP